MSSVNGTAMAESGWANTTSRGPRRAEVQRTWRARQDNKADINSVSNAIEVCLKSVVDTQCFFPRTVFREEGCLNTRKELVALQPRASWGTAISKDTCDAQWSYPLL